MSKQAVLRGGEKCQEERTASGGKRLRGSRAILHGVLWEGLRRTGEQRPDQPRRREPSCCEGENAPHSTCKGPERGASKVTGGKPRETIRPAGNPEGKIQQVDLPRVQEVEELGSKSQHVALPSGSSAS